MRFQELDNSLKKLKLRRKRQIFLVRRKEILSLEQLKEHMMHLTIKKLNIRQRPLILSIDLISKLKKVIFLNCILKKTTLVRIAATKDLLLARQLRTQLKLLLLILKELLQILQEVTVKNRKAKKKKRDKQKNSESNIIFKITFSSVWGLGFRV